MPKNNQGKSLNLLSIHYDPLFEGSRKSDKVAVNLNFFLDMIEVIYYGTKISEC
jgi:hypothetical protein